MSWAARRRFIIMVGIGALAFAFVAGLAISTFYRTPSCSDGKQNQDEAGVDCGGSCAYLCTAGQRAPTVLFTQTIQKGDGRVDIVASVINQNAAAAAKDVPYTVSLYGEDRILLRQIVGTLDLPPPPFGTVPVYIPNIQIEKQKVARAFLTIEPSSVKWFTMTNDPRSIPAVSNTLLSGTTTAPRIDAILSNQTIVTLYNVPVLVFVRTEAGQVIAASQTVLSTVPAQGQATATFTWNAAFSDVPAEIEIIPVIPLPAP